jgi:hypothetical protein
MALVVEELRAALVKARVDDKAGHLATADHLDARLAQLETRLIKWNVGAMAVLTALFSAIVKLL